MLKEPGQEAGQQHDNTKTQGGEPLVQLQLLHFALFFKFHTKYYSLGTAT